MTRQEFGKIAMAIRTYYPKERILPDDYAVELWFDALKDLDYQTARYAVKKWAETNQWSPSISDIRGMCATLLCGDFNTWEEEWQKVCEAISYFGYTHETEALDSLSEITRKIVVRLGFKNLCASENPAVDRANFRDIYNNLINKQKEREKLSEPIRKVLDTATERRYAIPEQKPMELPDKMPEAESEDSVALSDVAQEGLRKLREVLKGE